MIKRIVIDTGPLITLQRIEAIQTVGQLPFEFVAPEEVRAELDAGVSDPKAIRRPSALMP